MSWNDSHDEIQMVLADRKPGKQCIHAHAEISFRHEMVCTSRCCQGSFLGIYANVMSVLEDIVDDKEQNIQVGGSAYPSDWQEEGFAGPSDLQVEGSADPSDEQEGGFADPCSFT
jgi:hypothetical protein